MILLKTILKPSDIWYLDSITDTPYIDNKEDFNFYYLSRSGNKVISTLIDNAIDFSNQNGDISNNVKTIISNIIKNKFDKKWLDLYNLYSKEYDFDKPFNIKFNEKSSDTLTSSETNSGTRTIKDNSTDETINSEENTDNKRYGFNSVNPVPTDESSTNYTDKSKSDYNSTNTNSNTNSYNRTNPKSRDTSRVGNIGNITIQELVKQEREKLMYQLWDTICEDLDSVLTRSKYISY